MKHVVAILVVGFFALMIIGSCSDKKKGKRDSDYMFDCQKMIERQAQNPSSVDFKTMSSNVVHAKNGNIVVIMPFSAKNGLGLPMNHKARCLFTPDGESEISISN